jgi:dipeptidyl aminopeptidase/acylaminoacyl peptidase
MKRIIARLFMAAWFVGMVMVAVQGMPAQGQTPTVHTKYFPLITRRAFSLPPANWGDYVGLFIGNNQNGISTIFTVRGDGRELTPLTADARLKRVPTHSPDGRYIAYIHTADERYEAVMVINADGSNPQQLAASDETIYYEWSPTGNQLLVQVRQGYPFNLLLVDAESATTRPIASLPQDYATALLWGWSPDGRYIHFAQPGANNLILELWTEEIATGIRTRLSERMDALSQEPQWSPDSRELLFKQEEMWVAATPNSSTVRSLFDGNYSLKGWVMDNTHYLLGDGPDNSEGLAVLPVAGGSIVPIIPADRSISHLFIEPNGDSIFYQSQAIEPTLDGYLYWHSFAAGTTPVALKTCYGCDVNSATWAPDGQSLLFTLGGTSIFKAYLRPMPHPATQVPFYSDDAWSVAYLPGSSRLAMTTKTSSGSPLYYPPPFLDKPRLIDGESLPLSPFPFPTEGMFEFGEWRYLP